MRLPILRRKTQRSRREEAMLRAGAAAATAWRFPLPAADLALAPADLLQALNHENDGRAVRELEGYFVRELRTWRPDVVVTYHAVWWRRQLERACRAARIERREEPPQIRSQYRVTNEIGLVPW